GQLHLRQKEHAKAAAVLLAGWQKAPEPLKARFHYPAVEALYKAGRWAEAYETVGARDQTFSQLSYLLRRDRKGDELERLVAAHRHRAPKTTGLLEHAAHAQLLRGRAARAVALFQEAARKAPEATCEADAGRFATALADAGLHREAARTLPGAFRSLAS